MNEAPLTQDVIDGHSTESSTSDGLFSKAVKHPFVTGGALLAGAGLAYAAIKTIQSAADTPSTRAEDGDALDISDSRR